MALENGADLVVELPFLTAVQSADYFAAGAVDILSRLGIDSLTFGTEEVLDYQAIADVYAEKSEEMELLWKVCLVICLIHRRRKKCGKSLLVWTLLAIHPTIF